MTSLIERLRDWKNMRDCQEAATALEQARDLLRAASPPQIQPFQKNWYATYKSWLRLIAGEQEKEG